MARLLGHRQTKGADQTSHTYCYRATSLLYQMETVKPDHQNCSKADDRGLGPIASCVTAEYVPGAT
jgi:hypothetical protein